MSTRIYTRTGDRGETGLFGGQRVAKDDLRIEACGSVDELNCAIGIAASRCQDANLNALLLSLQQDLFQLGSDLATPSTGQVQHGRSVVVRIGPNDVERLEGEIDRWELELEPLRNFILPGGHPVAAELHNARAICRRAERRVVSLRRSEPQSEIPVDSDFVVQYLNRLSDLMFVLSRATNRQNEIADVIWIP